MTAESMMKFHGNPPDGQPPQEQSPPDTLNPVPANRPAESPLKENPWAISLKQLLAGNLVAVALVAWAKVLGTGHDLVIILLGALSYSAIRALYWDDYKRGSRGDVAWVTFCQVSLAGYLFTVLANLIVWSFFSPVE